ncbi:DUF971 domain-containing protein [Iodobacter sp. HSC-16F04]|uniref:DUF971 domain-containing protein n=1 Tax=Iodobacter violaceini TaxID=3044271 RepID=A0ABX0KN37_9NEIS|nr:DUF971 domain-containing protein [Iodobacter violacea]NHQ85071.1 DUF971 domain-containing protein [Iodobacter violacea]
MSGLSKTTPLPAEIKLHQASKQLEIHFDEGSCFILSCEYLRVHSPSAEVRGHGAGPGTLQVGKADVNIIDIVPVGNYAVKLVFDDGHDSGLYSWDHLYELGRHQAANWQAYLDKLADAGASRTL